jgi:uridine kinase
VRKALDSDRLGQHGRSPHARNEDGATLEITHVVSSIIAARAEIPSERSLLVGVTGIDGCGKGYVTDKLVSRLRSHVTNPVSINIDGWLNLPHKRFNTTNPAQHFYDHAIRFDELFEQLILPLREGRSRHIVADYAEERATEYRQERYDLDDVDVMHTARTSTYPFG